MSLIVILILNGVVLFAIAAMNSVWGKKSVLRNLNIQLVYGVFFGLVTMLLMNLAWGTETGVFYDSRTVLISVVAATYGGYTTLVMVILSSLYRLILGGVGTLAGIVTIPANAGIGVIFNFNIRDKIKKYKFFWYLVFGLVVHIFMLLYHFTLPLDLEFILNRIKLIAPSVLTLYPLFVAILFSIIDSGDQKIISMEKLAEREEQYRLLFNSLHSGVINFDMNGIIITSNDRFLEIMNAPREAMIDLDMHQIPNEKFQLVLKEVLEGKHSTYLGDYQSYLSGREMKLDCVFTPIYKNGVLQGGVGIIDDITESETLKETMHDILNRDSLTGLFNRKAFEEDILSNMFDKMSPSKAFIINNAGPTLFRSVGPA